MPTEEKLMEQIQNLLVERSKKPIELAKQAVLQEQLKYEPLGEALHYFMKEIWFNAAHPALLSLICEAVGGDPETVTNISASLVVLTGAADIHDDIIDQSVTKDVKLTVFGKYGKDMSLIAGDVLWFKGMLMLNQACESFSNDKKQAILELIKQAFFDIGSAEAKEANLRRKLDLKPEEYLEIIKMKVSVAEAIAKIGVIVGNGTSTQIENLGQFGKTLGMLMTIRDEFIDIFEIDELKNRFENECLPLPILYAFKNELTKNEILSLLETNELTETKLEKILVLVINAPEVRKLGRYIRKSVEETAQILVGLRKNGDIMVQLLESTLEDLPF
jgi:geranylgeranyl pyrophosphate synthase